jgi:hypothetical protein
MIKSRRMRKIDHLAGTVERENSYTILTENPGGKKLLASPRSRWKNNSKMDMKEIRREGVDWIHVVQDRDRWWAP